MIRSTIFGFMVMAVSCAHGHSAQNEAENAEDEDSLRANWRLECKVDHLRDDVKTCAISNDEPPFLLVAVGHDPPIVAAASSQRDSRNLEVTIRIDKHKGHVYLPFQPQVGAEESAIVLSEMLKGRTVRYEFFRLPTGTRQVALSLDGFRQRFSELQRELGQSVAPPTSSLASPRPSL